MPPKKKSGAAGGAGGAAAAAASSPSASASASAYAESERALLSELHALQSAHLQQRTHGAATWATAVAMLTKQVKELEGVLTRLRTLQAQQHARDKAAQAQAASSTTSTDAASDVMTVASGVRALAISPTQAQLTSLAQWLQREAPGSLYGTHWEFQSHASDEEGTGVRAVKPLEKGEQFMSIPRSVMMTSDGLSMTSPVGCYLMDSKNPLCHSNPSLLLAVCLLYERARGPTSRWSSYIRCLPRHFASSMPLLWPVDEVRRELQVSPTVFEVLQLQRAHVRYYTHLHEALTKGGFVHKKATPGEADTKGAQTKMFRFSWADFQWAICVLMSRQNQVPPIVSSSSSSSSPSSSSSSPSSPPTRPAIALIPGWDCCNHRGSGSIATYYSLSSQSSDSHAMEPVERGAPIYLFYGHRPNSQLLIYAGFVDAKHRSDHMAVEITMDGQPWATAQPIGAEGGDAAAAGASTDPLQKIKLMLLKKVGMGAGFMLKLPLQDWRSGFGPAAAASSEDREEADDDPEVAAQALARAQEAKQAARANFRAMQHFMRVACLSSKEEAALALKHKPDGLGGNPLLPSFHFLPSLFPRHDLCAWTFLHDALVACLQSYPTTLEHDEAELIRDESKRAANEHEPEAAPGQHDDPHTHPHATRTRHRLALEMRRAEKKMMQAAIDTVMHWKEDEEKKLNENSAPQQQQAEATAAAASTTK